MNHSEAKPVKLQEIHSGIVMGEAVWCFAANVSDVPVEVEIIFYFEEPGEDLILNSWVTTIAAGDWTKQSSVIQGALQAYTRCSINWLGEAGAIQGTICPARINSDFTTTQTGCVDLN